PVPGGAGAPRGCADRLAPRGSEHHARLRRDDRPVRLGKPQAGRDRGARRPRSRDPARAHRRRRRRRVRPGPGRAAASAADAAARRGRGRARRVARHRRRGSPVKTSTSERRGILLVAAAALLWSTGGIGIKRLSEPPLKIAFYRSATAAVALFAIFRPRIWRWTPAFLVGIVSYAACLTTFVLATKWTSAANAIFLQYCGVVWVLLAAPFVLGEPFHRRDAAAIAVAFSGMLLFFVGRFESRGFAGEIAALASSVFFAILVLSLRSERGGGAEAVVTYGNVLAAVTILPLVRRDLAVTPPAAAVLTYLGVVQIGGAYALFV